MYQLTENTEDMNGHWPYALEKDGEVTHWLKVGGEAYGVTLYNAYSVDRFSKPVTIQQSHYWAISDTHASGYDGFGRSTGKTIERT